MVEPGQRRTSLYSSERLWKTGFTICFVTLALLNLLILVEANQDAFSTSNQPYDFYVMLRGAAQIFTAPSQVYIWQAPSNVGAYWAQWLRDGSNYAYTPMFATLLSPMPGVYPPTAKLVFEGISFVTLVIACALVTRVVHWKPGKILVLLMAFAMPIPLIFTNQKLPATWGYPIVPGMVISPPFFADYYHGNANTMILALGLMSFYFASRGSTVSTRIGSIKIPFYAISSVFVALDTFKVTAVLFVFPFWLILVRRHLTRAIFVFVVSLVVLNGVVLFEPALLSGYWSKLMIEQSIPTGSSPLWQLYEYVWYYTLPLAGLMTIISGRRRPASLPLTENGVTRSIG